MTRHDLDQALPGIIEEYEAGASASSLSKKYAANIWSILNRLRKAGIYIRSNKEQNEKHLNLNKSQSEKFISIVDGLLLGDGRIGQKGILRLEQSKKRLGWLDHVANNLASIGVNSRIIPVKPRDRYIDGRKVHFKGGGIVYTPCYVECQDQRKRWYPKGEKRVPDDVIFSPLSIAYWFAGDGTGHSSGPLCFYTNCFRKKEVQHLASGLIKFGIEARCVPRYRETNSKNRKREYIVLITKKESTCKLKKIIAPHMPECCMYKLRYVSPKSNNRAGTLSYDQAVAIRKKHQDGKTQVQLALEYGVAPPTIGSIVRFRTYKTRKSNRQQ